MISLQEANPSNGGMEMRAMDYWNIFMETGAPEMYLMYQQALKMEANHVFDNPGASASDRRLQ